MVLKNDLIADQFSGSDLSPCGRGVLDKEICLPYNTTNHLIVGEVAYEA